MDDLDAILGPLPHPMWELSGASAYGNAFSESQLRSERSRAYAAGVAAERERIASMLEAEHEKRKGADNLAAVFARMVRES